MATKLTFKQYIESKTKLLEAAKKSVPQHTAKYCVNKYCKLVVGESKLEKEYINLKPQHTVLVEWLYDDKENPTLIGIKFEGVNDVDPDDEFTSYWGGERLKRWLERNTKENF